MELRTSWPRNPSQTSIEICYLPLIREGLICLKTRDCSHRLSASSVALHVAARTALTMRQTRKDDLANSVAGVVAALASSAHGYDSMDWVGGPETGQGLSLLATSLLQQRTFAVVTKHEDEDEGR
jgi:hypothetical protein